MKAAVIFLLLGSIAFGQTESADKSPSATRSCCGLCSRRKARYQPGPCGLLARWDLSGAAYSALPFRVCPSSFSPPVSSVSRVSTGFSYYPHAI